LVLARSDTSDSARSGSGYRRDYISDGQLSFELSYDGLADVQEAHLHIANPGNNGGIVVFLCSNLGNVLAGATPRECPPPPGEVAGEIIATDVLPVVEDTTTIIEAGDLPGLIRLVRQGSVLCKRAHPSASSGRNSRPALSKDPLTAF
jgi:hypothetical protein